ncbi:cytochrome c oxidase subunit 3 [Occallatibacter riparius]|uniref:Cytochrome c oxidase subunit 3 n=1 Tax=Occallatibacter riparius TaxID=1002689 RepID=A0A9J7BXL2_9BACT|nr:cytochrome c oxidase subunit 3 [Occallatibacter riparius]UWZ86682.1 cytochrome c oxidase subunit 3 [Occallatibacter riparius]
MSTVQIPPPQVKVATLPIDQKRGLNAMWCVIATEFMLFVSMFGAYYYLGSNKDRWADHVAPKYWLALILMAILLASSAVLMWGEKQAEAERFSMARIACWITILIGAGFMALQGYEYSVEWKDETPYSDSYGSIFYTITTLHALHVIAGLLMLLYIGVMPRYGWTRRTPHKPYKTVAMYWHFVDAVWVLIVLLLYIIPNIQRYMHVHH